MPNATGLPEYLVNGSSVYLWVDDDGSGDEAWMLINLILRGNQTGSSQFVGRLTDDFLGVDPSSIAPVAWDCEPPAQSNPIGINSRCFQEGGGLFKTAAGTWFVLGGSKYAKLKPPPTHSPTKRCPLTCETPCRAHSPRNFSLPSKQTGAVSVLVAQTRRSGAQTVGPRGRTRTSAG
jgi:hypothetical protein